MRIGAYVLPGDPVWMRSSLIRYYDLLDDLVVLVPRSGKGWRGTRLPVAECLGIVAAVDVRRIARYVEGEWYDPAEPLRAETAQRRDGVEALRDSVDWVIQIDNDEVLPESRQLLRYMVMAEEAGCVQVDWPLRVLYRRRGKNLFLEVCGERGETVSEFAPVAVRAEASLVETRRAEGGILRVVIDGDDRSLLVRREPAENEVRVVDLLEADAILHNSWARTPREVWSKTRSWGHYAGARGVVYYLRRWIPSVWLWRSMKDFHPFSSGLWPRLRVYRVPPNLLHPSDR
jgi:hypothetical protein